MAARANPSAFGKRGTFALVAFAILAFVAFLYLVGQGGLSGSGNNGQSHVAGNGLNGFSALARMLEADGTPVARSRERGALDDPGLLVLPPPQQLDTDELDEIIARRRTIGPTLVIAPKWVAFPVGDAADQPGWVALAGAAPEWSFDLDGETYDLVGETALARAPQWSGLSLGGRLPSEDALMHFSANETQDRIAPLVQDEEGHILAGHLVDDGSYRAGELYFDPDWGGDLPVYGVMIVAEPDLLNNWGLASESRAALALELIDIARQGTDAPVRFDLTLNGLGGSRNLLTLAFEPPFLAATLTLLLALAIAMWRAFNRFGPSLRPTPAIAAGKGQLVANGAQVIGRSGRMHLLRDPYANLVGTRVLERLGLRERQGQAIEASLRERGEDTLAQAIEDLRDARGSTETLRAARALRETELRESERTTKV
ncbi:MAG: hypothetical protein CL801_08320 [Citromicrobium sp.]|nr:hypothetical protein [Citromicrobium sp.]